MRDILTYAETCQTWTNSVAYAAQLSALLDASLTGIFVHEPLPPLPAFVAPPAMTDLYANVAGQVRRAQAAGASFVGFANDHGVAHARWQVAEGPLPDVLAYAGNWHDLLVLGTGTDSHWDTVAGVGRLLLDAGLPCLVVPPAFSSPARMNTIAVAWNDSPESVRALHAALPLLRHADRVVMLRGRREDPYSLIGWKPPWNVDAYLARHGVDVDVVPVEDDDQAGRQLLSSALQVDANLLVMGAYGRSRFSEWVFGGATRHLLENASMPVFMRH